MADAEGIQQELQDYLQQKGINTLFISIVESLLLTKPDNPIQHIITYLTSNFPEQCKNIQSFLKAKVGPDPEEDPALSSSRKGLYHSDESESEDEEEFDDIGEMHSSSRHVIKGRRSSVSAETASNTKTMEPVKYPKSDAERKRILDILGDNILFKGLEEKQTQILLDAMFPKEYEQNQTIIEQGADGDNFYILDSGVCEVYVNGDLVQTCTESMSFGELALMYNSPRAATVKAKEFSKVWALDRHTFKYIIMETTKRRRESREAFIRKVPILESLSELERLKVADALKIEVFNDNEVIIRQNEQGNHFYIIEEGVAVCTKVTDPNESVQVIGELSTGAYFGEIALLTSRPRQATVTAKGTVKCLALDRKTFKRVMGPLEDILKRSMDQYNLVMANTI